MSKIHLVVKHPTLAGAFKIVEVSGNLTINSHSLNRDYGDESAIQDLLDSTVSKVSGSWTEYLTGALLQTDIDAIYVWNPIKGIWRQIDISALRNPNGETLITFENPPNGPYFTDSEVSVIKKAVESLIFTCNTIRRGKKSIVSLGEDILERLENYNP